MLLITEGSQRVLCTLLVSLLHVVSIDALNVTDPLARSSIQKSYDLTKYLEHQLRSLAGPYVKLNSGERNTADSSENKAAVLYMQTATLFSELSVSVL
ncbi:hypothetical protein GDO78_015264 [Eleutherodactylus coqui]|uniref:Uncharacterized protein n=1 Tax=Eleutherodactylus coqui TaxID=57060 RepID=A0A8J6B0W7_ELECQ|nr:hypothetical protein GDO78_015264 [Eleutherodactylus coqui]